MGTFCNHTVADVTLGVLSVLVKCISKAALHCDSLKGEWDESKMFTRCSVARYKAIVQFDPKISLVALNRG